MSRVLRSQLLYEGCYAHVISRSIRKLKLFNDDFDLFCASSTGLTGDFFFGSSIGLTGDFFFCSLIENLRTKLVDVEELELVKNYLLGTFLRSIDGAFALAQKFTGIYFYDLTYDYYKKYFETIRNITPEELKDLANKYLQEKDLLELVVGKK